MKSMKLPKNRCVTVYYFENSPTFRPNKPRVGRQLRIAHGRDITRKTAVWRACGAVGRRKPYNLTLESKTYYTQNYDTMR